MQSLLLSFQIDVAVNAPEAGTIKEFLANEEDTVTVGQKLVLLELGGAPSGRGNEKAESAPKDSASKEQSTSSDPEASKKEESKSKEEMSPPPAQDKQEKKPEPKKESPPPKQAEARPSSSASGVGNREERRV